MPRTLASHIIVLGKDHYINTTFGNNMDILFSHITTTEPVAKHGGREGMHDQVYWSRAVPDLSNLTMAMWRVKIPQPLFRWHRYLLQVNLSRGIINTCHSFDKTSASRALAWLIRIYRHMDQKKANQTTLTAAFWNSAILLAHISRRFPETAKVASNNRGDYPWNHTLPFYYIILDHNNQCNCCREDK